jgi:SNF2 family DNA or RNA helicase
MFRTPEDTQRAYERFLRKKNFRKAYQCLENLLHQFPGDESLLVDIVNLAYFEWRNYEAARPWLINLTRLRSFWKDYFLLSEGEAERGSTAKAKEYLKKAEHLLHRCASPREKKEAKALLVRQGDIIRYHEWKSLQKSRAAEDVPKKKEEAKQDLPEKTSGEAIQKQHKELPPENGRKEEPPAIPQHAIPVHISISQEDALKVFQAGSFAPLEEIRLLMDYSHLTIQNSFDELLCLNALEGVDRYWYQVETVKKALKHFRGRALLCDEVGLGKTIEAGMVIKEYVMRGMVGNVLILTPSSLVSQWKEEMETKFGLSFVTTEEMAGLEDPEAFWKEKYLIASLHTAKSRKNLPFVTRQFYDLVVVDEAHHLRNRATQAWKLINEIQKRFILLLSATPLQNNLIELFNLITLLKPGQFKTEKLFKQEYLKKGSLRTPASREKLRELLRDVMIRNTRSAIDLKLPKRFATTLRLEPTEIEREIYQGLNDYLRGRRCNRLTVYHLLREAGSIPFALRQSLLRMEDGGPDRDRIIGSIDRLQEVSKGKALVEILRKNPEEKKVIFAQYLRTHDYITDLLRRNGIPHAAFKGTMTPEEKERAIIRFRDEIPVLVSTESGGEGRNLQFCNTLINFDLPWNPMKIEQRIGRLHRIGQTRDVFIFNLSVKETLEDYILDVLDSKINMFEMVIGEIEPILGHLEREEEFEEIIMGIWLDSSNGGELKKGFNVLGEELLKAKKEYLKGKSFDEEVFGHDYEI